MKATMKILSLALVLVMAISVVILPVSAGGPDKNGYDHRVGVTMKLSKELERKDAAGLDPVENNIYRLDFYLTSKVILNSHTFNLYYDETKFEPVDGEYDDYTTAADQEYPNVLEQWHGEALLDANGYDASGNVVTKRPKYTGPSHPNAKEFVLESTVSIAETGCLNLSYEAALNVREIGACQNEKYFSVFFKLKAGANPEGAKFRIGNGRDGSVKQVGLDMGPALNKFFSNTVRPYNVLDKESIYTPDYTYHETNVSFLKNQIMFDKDEAGAFANSYKVRTCAQIPSTVAKESITEAGFLFLNGNTMDLDLAKKDVEKAVADGKKFGDTTENGYTFAPVSYIQTNADNYMFTCIVENITVDEGDFQVLGYAKINGAYEFFDATNICDFNILYNSRWAAAAAAYKWAATAPDLPDSLS